jgi:HEAT repeat protein
LYPVDLRPVDLRRRAGLLVVTAALLGVTGCSTTEEQVRAEIEVLAANDVGTDAHQGAVEALTAIGRPGARQLVALLNPGLYRGVSYREFRDERERTLTGAATVLGNIRHRAASGSMKDRISAAYRTSERHAALRAVGELGFNEAAVTALSNQLADEDAQIRLLAAVALAKLGEATAHDTIVRAVLSDDSELSDLALVELRNANYHGVPILVDLQATGQRTEAIARALSTVRDQLIDQLGADDPDVRQASAAALGAVGDAAALEPLRALLGDPSNLVRFHAASSMVRLGDDGGSAFLFDALGNPDPILRLNAIKSLVRVQQLAGGVEDRLLSCLTDQDPALRSGAAQILGQAGVQSALTPLLGLLDDDDAEVRWNAAIGLGHLAQPASREALQLLVDDPHETVAYYATWALDQLADGRRGAGS